MRTMDRIRVALPAPAKWVARRARTAVDPARVAVYRRRTGFRDPIPPARIRIRSGTRSLEASAAHGRTNAEDLAEALATQGRSFADFASVYDFGCGSGRVLRHVMGRGGPQTRFTGSDVDADAVGWARANLPGARWEVSSFLPPLPFADGEFDLVYSISIFTHFDEPTQFRWLEELARVVRPGGLALLTTHGEHAYQAMKRDGEHAPDPESFVARMASHGPLEEEGFVYEPFEITAWNKSEYPGIEGSFGQTAHSEHYVRERWTTDFELLAALPRRIGGWQDCMVLRRR
jgi:SAM-dependent methyltransferase